MAGRSRTSQSRKKSRRPVAPVDGPCRSLHGRLWVEAGGRPAINDAAADLLEQIGVCGSLSEAARRLRFSYRRAWMLLDLVNHRWPGPLVITATGGRRGGGATLTELGRHVLQTYRSLQIQLEHLLAQAGDPFVPMP
jgi:molybdate transport system regulatory protein